MRQADAQYLPDCYTRKLSNPDIVCSLCGTDLADPESDCPNFPSNTTGKIFDAGICMCVADTLGGNCDSLSKSTIVSSRNSCYQSGGFWAERYCTCNYGGSFTPVAIDDEVENFKNEAFFQTNFDGSIDNVAEFVRMAFILGFAAVAVISAVVGFYGMGLYSTAGEKDEQIEKGKAVLKAGIVGAAVAIFGIVLVQVVALAAGVSDSLTDATFDISNAAP